MELQAQNLMTLSSGSIERCCLLVVVEELAVDGDERGGLRRAAEQDARDGAPEADRVVRDALQSIMINQPINQSINLYQYLGINDKVGSGQGWDRTGRLLGLSSL